MERHPTPLQVITTRAWKGTGGYHLTRAREGSFTRPSKNGHVKLIQLHMYQALHYFQSSTHCLAASTIIPLLPKADFTPSIQPDLGRPRTRLPLTSSINTLLAIRHLSIWPYFVLTLFLSLLTVFCSSSVSLSYLIFSVSMYKCIISIFSNKILKELSFLLYWNQLCFGCWNVFKLNNHYNIRNDVHSLWTKQVVLYTC